MLVEEIRSFALTHWFLYKGQDKQDPAMHTGATGDTWHMKFYMEHIIYD
jgi:hypothetical protein